MRYAGLDKNDFVNGEGVCVSFWTQGCPFHCKGCHNPETWDFNGGIEYTNDVKWDIIKAISANGIIRNFSILGGEPLAPQNLPLTDEIVTAVRAAYPHIKIYLWTGYKLENLIKDPNYYNILDCIDTLIDGQYQDDLRDLSLKFRGSSNQRVWVQENNEWRRANEQ